jgi:hypothetical protein
MSRAINLNATEASVIALCVKHAAVISSIEALLSGGTRVVLTDGDGAARVRNASGGKVLTGAVRRQPFRAVYASSPFGASAADMHPQAGASAPWKAGA